MNLTGQSVYLKAESSGKQPTRKQRERWEVLRAMGCSVASCFKRFIEIHHCDTGKGGRKNHDKVIPLCQFHHTGEQGIHTIGRKKWEAQFGTEQEHMDKYRGIK